MRLGKVCGLARAEKRQVLTLTHMVSRDTLMELEVWTGGRVDGGVDGRVGEQKRAG